MKADDLFWSSTQTGLVLLPRAETPFQKSWIHRWCIFKLLHQTTYYVQNYLLNCFIVFLAHYKILPAKPLGCSLFLFSWVRVMPTFQTTRYAFPGCPWYLVRCFLAIECLKSWLGKPASKSVDGCCTLVFDWEKTPLKESLPVHECNTGFV